MDTASEALASANPQSAAESKSAASAPAAARWLAHPTPEPPTRTNQLLSELEREIATAQVYSPCE